MNEPDDPWKRLVEKAKTEPTNEAPSPEPKLIVQRLLEVVPSLLLALTWRKWSILAAALAGLGLLAFFLIHGDNDQPEGPIIQPEPPSSSIEP